MAMVVVTVKAVGVSLARRSRTAVEQAEVLCGNFAA